MAADAETDWKSAGAGLVRKEEYLSMEAEKEEIIAAQCIVTAGLNLTNAMFFFAIRWCRHAPCGTIRHREEVD